ncbi:Uncharacterized protein FKW44_021156, partial [Caligus rogercresseyi]
CESASYEHSGIHSTVMGLCHSGRSVVLGDRRSVALIDLTGSGSVIKSSPRASKWDVSKIASHGDSLALASNDCIDLLDSELPAHHGSELEVELGSLCIFEYFSGPQCTSLGSSIHKEAATNDAQRNDWSFT